MKLFFFLAGLGSLLAACNKSAPGPTACVDVKLAKRLEYSPCPLNVDPVCGCNGVTYNNACEATRAGVRSSTPGRCP